jgi:hypothetical protein
MFRKNFDVKTICMHGSPRSKYDNKIIWTKYDYKMLGILGEPYLDIDWNEWGYFTDTGRRWDGEGVSVRDKVVRSQRSEVRDQKSEAGRKFRRTKDIIEKVHQLPQKVMITIHPERWTDNIFEWTKQLIFQNVKNVVKRIMIAMPGR